MPSPRLDEFARDADPFGKIGRRAVTVDVTSVVRASDRSFRIAWIEHPYADGAPLPAENWSAILTVVIQTPRTEARLRQNPLGIYIDAISWAQELNGPERWRHPMIRILLLSSACALALSACAARPPRISYDEPQPARLEPEPPKPVEVVSVPELLPLPGQLKPVPPTTAAPPPEPRDPARRVALANAAARVDPTRDGYVNAMQVFPFSDGALYQIYVAPLHVTDIALEPGEQLKSVAAGDTVQWKIGDTESGAGNDRQVHVLVKPVSAQLPMNNLVILTDRRSYHLEAHPTPETYMAEVSWRYPRG